MSKEIYVVNCYTCQHNGQETCKGCNTLLNGDVEPYENWELREDLSQKDQRIAELEQEFAELKEKYNKTNEKLKNITEEIDNNFVHGQDYEKLKQELSELKQKAIVPRFEYGDKVYYIKYFVGKWQVFNQEYVGENISNIIVRTMNYYSELPKDSVFATEQEAQAKLKEMKGNGQENYNS